MTVDWFIGASISDKLIVQYWLLIPLFGKAIPILYDDICDSSTCLSVKFQLDAPVLIELFLFKYLVKGIRSS